MDPGSALYEVLFPVSRFLMFFNFFQFLFTAVPMRYRVVCRGLDSDGLQIVRTLKHEKVQQENGKIKTNPNIQRFADGLNPAG